MSNAIEEKRQGLIDNILRRDTALAEFYLAILSLINAAQVLTIQEGKSLAPFLFSAFDAFSFNGAYWVAALVFYGAAALVALTLGLSNGNSFYWRSMVSLGGAMLWVVVAVATASSGFPAVIVFRYGFTAFLALVTALILVVKHDFKNGAH